MSTGSGQGPARAEYCPSCGMPLPQAAAACGVCGRVVATPVMPEALPTAGGEPTQAALPVTLPVALPVVVPVVAPAPARAAEASPVASAPTPVAVSVASGPLGEPPRPSVVPPLATSAPWPADAAQAWPASSSTQPLPWGNPPAGWAPAPPAQSPGGWAPNAATIPAGMAALATTPVATAPARRTRRAGLIAGIAAICLVALLGGSAYWVFAAFLSAAHQTASARYLPDNTEYFTSVDLVAAATNSHHISRADLGRASGTSDPLKQSIGLDWQTDVLPWVGRSITVASFPAVPGGGGTAAVVPFGGALLIDSRDDAAAQRSVQKALDFQRQKGVSFTASTYGGYTLHVSSGEGMATTIATGSGLVLVTTSIDAAHAVIDRANGHGTTLAGSADFQRATGDLPASRFGTMYLNLRALASLGGSGVGARRFPFLDAYPSAGGALLWTTTGLRWQVAFKPAHAGVPRSMLSGDTTGLASMVPDHVAMYTGVANAGRFVEEFARVVTPDGAASPTSMDDALQQSLGAAPSDPVLQQPAAVVMLPTTAGTHGASQSGALLLRAPDTSAANALLQRLAQHQHMTMQPIVVDGIPATAFYAAASSEAASPAPRLFPVGASAPSPDAMLAPAGPRLAGVAAMVNGTLVVASTTESLTTIVETAHGNHANLAQSARFRQLVTQAPAGAASTIYLDLSSLQQLYHAAAGDNGSLVAHVMATLFTLVWDHSTLQGTYDVSLDQ